MSKTFSSAYFRQRFAEVTTEQQLCPMGRSGTRSVGRARRRLPNPLHRILPLVIPPGGEGTPSDPPSRQRLEPPGSRTGGT